MKLHKTWLSLKVIDGGLFLISLLINDIFFYWWHNWMLQCATSAPFPLFPVIWTIMSCEKYIINLCVCVWAALKRRTQCRSFQRRSLKEVQFQVMLLSSRTDLFSPPPSLPVTTSFAPQILFSSPSLICFTRLGKRKLFDVLFKAFMRAASDLSRSAILNSLSLAPTLSLLLSLCLSLSFCHLLLLSPFSFSARRCYRGLVSELLLFWLSLFARIVREFCWRLRERWVCWHLAQCTSQSLAGSRTLNKPRTSADLSAQLFVINIRDSWKYL